jgi:hypothetical protein
MSSPTLNPPRVTVPPPPVQEELAVTFLRHNLKESHARNKVLYRKAANAWKAGFLAGALTVAGGTALILLAINVYYAL